MQTSTARPYEPPFEGMVESDPTFEEMKKIVCEEKRRPPLEHRWLQGQSVRVFIDFSKFIDNFFR